MRILLISAMVLLCFSCRRKLNPEEVKKELANAMLSNLWNDHQKDTTNVKYEILKVTYFAERTFYRCEYKVHMHILTTGYDTIGTMTASISKDFKIVKRKL